MTNWEWPDLNTVRGQMLANRSRTTSLNVKHMRSRTVHEQPFADRVVLLLNTVWVTPRLIIRGFYIVCFLDTRKES